MPFDIKTATSIVQMYDGTAEHLDAYIDAANLLKDYVEADQVETAVRFLKTRLTGKARIGLAVNLNNIDELINDVRTRCAEQIAPESIIAKLKASKQKGDINNLCDEVDNLTNKLKNVYVSQGIPDPVAKTMATKAGVDALINGTTSFETKIILRAGNFANIKEAVQKVQENTGPSQTNNQNISQIMAYGSRQNNFGRNMRGRRMTNRGGYSNPSRDRNYQNNHTRFQGNYQGRFQHRSNHHNGGFNRGGRGGNRHRQIFSANAEQAQPMVQYVPYAPVQNVQQNTLPTATPQQGMNFLCRANQGPSPQQQFIR